MKRTILFISILIIFQLAAGQQPYKFTPNHDESKVPKFEVPDPLTSFEGKIINNIRKWEKTRRPELLKFFTNHIYGTVPGKLKISSWEVVEADDNALGGKARRKQVDIVVGKNDKSIQFTLLIYLPKGVDRSPLFAGYNFYGNHTVTDDVHVRISDAWARNNSSYGISNHRLTEKSRGLRAEAWQVEKILEAGYGLATIFYCEVDPDKDDFSDGVHPLLYARGQEKPADHEWGAIAAWAWGLSRAMDYFKEDPEIDESSIIVFGHSRLGKTSLWAGATDQRFAGVISNNSGCGGAALSKRQFGETVARINHSFPHWFCENFNLYNEKESLLPVDQHHLLALIAPRPLYVASAEEDLWADPKGEFLSALFATPAYELYGEKAITDRMMPPVNQPIQNTVAYHIRPGKHGVTAYDWEQYIRWANHNILRK
jgi:hypothetical protein